MSTQQTFASIGQVSSNIAHELRNPMAAIRNSVYFLRLKNEKDPKINHHLEVIDRELSRSDEVIERLVGWQYKLIETRVAFWKRCSTTLVG